MGTFINVRCRLRICEISVIWKKVKYFLKIPLIQNRLYFIFIEIMSSKANLRFLQNFWVGESKPLSNIITYQYHYYFSIRENRKSVFWNYFICQIYVTKSLSFHSFCLFSFLSIENIIKKVIMTTARRSRIPCIIA